MAMCKLVVRRYIWVFVLLVASGFSGSSIAGAADMTITTLVPANNAVEAYADTKLWITFGTAPIVATDSNMHLQICRVSDDNVVYQLDLNTLPVDAYGPVSGGWPYKITLAPTKVFNYQPFAVSGNTLEIYPSTRLDYNTPYYVKMTHGFCTDANGYTSPDINNNTTWRFTTRASAPAADHDYTVALDGSGDFCTMQGAVDAVVNNDPCRTLIKVKKGTYREIVYILSSKMNMTWLGEDRDTTILNVYNREAFNSGGDARMMIRCYANGFRMYNMTYHNLTQKGGSNAQAETIKHSGLQSIVKNCKFMSYQDTVCFNGQMYLEDCYLEGDTDYIWGYGTVYFDRCELRSLSTKSHVTQPRAAAPPANGFFLVDCNLTSPPGITQCDLGRTTNNSYPYCQSVYINCTMPSILFLPAGWTIVSGTDTNNLRWWEYKSVDPVGNLIDVSGRVPYSKQLDDANALYWRDVNHVYAQNPWNPQNLGELPTAAWQPSPTDGASVVSVEGGISLTWAAGAEATSHMVYFGTDNPPEFAVEQNETSFATGEMSIDTTYYWRIDEKNSAGTTTGTVWSFTAARYICPNPVASDLNGDCEVDFYDFVRFADAWAGNPPEVDLNNDETLNYYDLKQFADDWLTCNREPQSECWQ